jgi:hypothetical protein
MKTYTPIMLLILSGVFAFAGSQDTTAEILTLSDFLKEAALNNAQLKASFEGWKAALEQIPQAEALQDPKFTFGYYIEEVETRHFPGLEKSKPGQTPHPQKPMPPAKGTRRLSLNCLTKSNKTILSIVIWQLRFRSPTKTFNYSRISNRLPEQNIKRPPPLTRISFGHKSN